MGPVNTYGLLAPQVTLTYGYDTMGRPNALTDLNGATGAGFSWPSGTPVNVVQNVQYDYAGRMTVMQYLDGFYNVPGPPYFGALAKTSGWMQRSMSYNVNGQLGSIGFAGPDVGPGTATPINVITYTYSATQNNGQITQAADTVISGGETIVYQYDALKRLISTSATPVYPLGPPAAYTEAFQYDGFGNLTGKTLNGTTTPIGVNAATNRLSGASYDLNGNMTSGSGATLTYDVANRVFSAAETSGGIEFYGYAADNRRFYKYTSTGTEELTFYGGHGENLGVFSITFDPAYLRLDIYPASTNVWFAGQMVLESSTSAKMDRLGTNRATGGPFYSYGDGVTPPSSGGEKFATYTRDGYATVGLIMPIQRYLCVDEFMGGLIQLTPYQASGVCRVIPVVGTDIRIQRAIQ